MSRDHDHLCAALLVGFLTGQALSEEKTSNSICDVPGAWTKHLRKLEAKHQDEYQDYITEMAAQDRQPLRFYEWYEERESARKRARDAANNWRDPWWVAVVEYVLLVIVLPTFFGFIAKLFH